MKRLMLILVLLAALISPIYSASKEKLQWTNRSFSAVKSDPGQLFKCLADVFNGTKPIGRDATAILSAKITLRQLRAIKKQIANFSITTESNLKKWRPWASAYSRHNLFLKILEK